MPRRRGATDLAGVLLVDKPAGMTSHDVVAAVRRWSGEGRVGHAGTLDPAATGLLVVLIGPYTRLEPYLAAAQKSYEATISFGTATDTDDADGAVLETAPVPETVFDRAYAEELLHGFLGEQEQVPPAYSAIKVGGQTAHRVARSGGHLEVKPRRIQVLEARLLSADGVAGTWRVAFTVSKGTYIRAIARDLGRAAGTLAHLCELRRTASGELHVSDAVLLDGVRNAASEGNLPGLFTDPLAALGMPVLEVAAEAVANGGELVAPPDAVPGTRYAVVAGGVLLAVYHAESGRLLADAVFPRNT